MTWKCLSMIFAYKIIDCMIVELNYCLIRQKIQNNACGIFLMDFFLSLIFFKEVNFIILHSIKNARKII